MNNFSKKLNWMLGGALLVSLIFSWISPKIIGLLFTAPVSFGINCEPAGHWAMEKLMYTQFAGVIIGLIAGAVLAFGSKKKDQESKSV
jgi:hypothetical protein